MATAVLDEAAVSRGAVVIIDYGSGNLHSARKAFQRAAHEQGIDCDVVVSGKPEDVRAAERIVLPGVGACADCRRGLDSLGGMIEALEETVIRSGRPFLGICVGMQLMATRGLEFGITPGLGWIAGDVTAITPDDPSLKIPHMGWNTLDVVRPHALLEGLPTGPSGLNAYFVHSFQLAPTHGETLIARTDYDGPVTAMVGRDNMVGTQFHPEKSQRLGLGLIGRFLAWRP